MMEPGRISEPTLKRYIEWMTRGRKTGRTAYVIHEWDLPSCLPGAEWAIDPDFNAIEELKTNRELRKTVVNVVKAGLPVVDAVEVTRKPSRDLPDDTRIVDVDLPARIHNTLARNGIATVGELRAMPDKALLSFQHMGRRSLAYLRERLG
jgi:DNA-directed RNA polymerase alpha subunit